MSEESNVKSHPGSLREAVEVESQKFEKCYSWLEQAMPETFFNEVDTEHISLVAHALVGFDLQAYFSTINIKNHTALVMCLDSADADLRILENFTDFGITNYQCYLSSLPPPECHANLRIALLHFSESFAKEENFKFDFKEKLFGLLKIKNPEITEEAFDHLVNSINPSFLRAQPIEVLVLAIAMFYRAKTRDTCQYEVRYLEQWVLQKSASMQIVLAWKNTPKYNFLYQLAELIQHHNLMMKKVSATYVDPYSADSTLIMVLDLHGADGKAAWDATNLPDFLRDLATAKYFEKSDIIDSLLVEKKIINGADGNFLRAMTTFIHQGLVHIDPNLYTAEKIKEDLCRHPEFTIKLIEAFTFKFHPEFHNLAQFQVISQKLEKDIDKLDTGIEENDTRRKNILRLGLSFIKHTLKTNFFRLNYTALSFRLDPKYLDDIPFEDRSKKFPELPFGIFFIQGMDFFGFHIRFKDLARGGLRTVYLEQSEHLQRECNHVFLECYNLAYTQNLKNKDIPEAGAKGIIFLSSWDRINFEAKILENELTNVSLDDKEIERHIEIFKKQQKEEFLNHSQRSFVEALITLVNSDAEGKLRAKNVLDYWGKPEYLYLGPDENMHDDMINWIANYSKRHGYKPGSAFISSKPGSGINHKEYGVTSLGVNVYMEMMLLYLGIDPTKDPFTVKISGGPDGDVAGNQILNLSKYYRTTGKLLALTDVSGTIYDPNGLDYSVLVELFKQTKPIRYYPPEKLSDGGFLLDKYSKRSQVSFAQQTLCWKKIDGKLVEDWLSGNEMNQLWRNNVHQVKTDIFIPAGGRPRALNETNVKEFLDGNGKPTARAIIEGANLYLTPRARRALEKLGVLIIKDSSANKTGVICSSFEVLCGLTLGDEKFLSLKPELIKEILARLHECAYNEGNLLLRTHLETEEFLTDISATISERIILFTNQLYEYLEPQVLTNDPEDPLMQCFFDYCLPILRNQFKAELLKEIPDLHKKAIIARYLAAQTVYKKGLNWWPSIVDILPILLEFKANSD